MDISVAYHLCEQELHRRCPALYRAGRVLYVGANRTARPALADGLLGAGAELHLLELWGPNVVHYQERETELFASITQGDVRDVAEMNLGTFNAVVWWHGPEHLDCDTWPGVLRGLEGLAPLVVVGAPWGRWEQGVTDDNPHETHQDYIYPAALQSLGYTVQTVGAGPDRKDVLVAWKGESGMSGEDWYYAKLGDSATFWLVRDGQREAMASIAEVYRHGLLEVRLVGREELEDIPVKGEGEPEPAGMGDGE